MQIIPAYHSDADYEYSSHSGRDGLGFARLVEDYLADSPAEVTPSFDDSPYADSNAFAAVGSAEDPFASNDTLYLQTSTTMGSVDTPEEIRFTSEEVRRIAEALKKDGVDPEIVRAMENLVGPMGVTAADMLQALAAVARPAAKVSDADLARIASLANTIDPEGSLAGMLVDDVRAGRTLSGWQRLLESLKSMDADAQLQVNRDDIISLGKGLGLSQKTLDTLHKSFSGADSLHTTPGKLEQLLVPVQAELGERKAQLEKLAASFEKALSPVTNDARKRISAEQAASARSSRSTEQSEILIHDTVTRKGLARQHEVEGAVKDESSESRLSAERLESMLAQRQHDKNAERPDNRNNQHEGGANSSRRGAWENMLDRVQVRESAVDSLASQMQSLLNSAASATSQQVPQPVAMQPGTTPQNVAQAPYASQVYNQVEQGMLTAMRNGATRIELQLSPEHLGTLSIVLTVKNGEVSALMRPERPETAAMLNQQAEQLRASLEAEGLKVEKVEVQTQMQDNRHMSWQGMDQHNLARDHQAQTEQRNQIIRLGRLHRTDAENVEQNMHNSDGSVGLSSHNAERGLHIVT